MKWVYLCAALAVWLFSCGRSIAGEVVSPAMPEPTYLAKGASNLSTVPDLATALNAADWSWTNSHWTVSVDRSHDGVASAHGEVWTDKYLGFWPQTCDLGTAVTGPGLLSFWVDDSRVRLLLDGRSWYRSFTLSEVWQQALVAVPEGRHALLWQTETFIGTRANLDEVAFAPNRPGAPTVVSRYTCGEGSERMLGVLLGGSPEPRSYQWYVHDPSVYWQDHSGPLSFPVPEGTQATLAVRKPSTCVYTVVVTTARGVAIAGPSSAADWPTPLTLRLTTSGVTKAGRRAFAVEAPTGLSVQVQSSADLLSWEDWGLGMATNGVAEVSGEANRGAGTQFYRAIAQ